jgi:hypothetical protein
MTDPQDLLNRSWNYLNNILVTINDEDLLWNMLEQELTGQNRGTFAMRIHSRANKLRAAREREEIIRRSAGSAKSRVSAYPSLRKYVREEEEA